jgi:autotransporter-associated beta strand protein
MLAMSCFIAKAAPLPDDLRVTVTAENQTQTLNLHKRTCRASTFELLTWDDTNGYQSVTPAPEVRTFRGTITENPNAVVYASIDTNNLIRAYCFDMDNNHNSRWYVVADVSSQLGSPVTPSPMPAQTIGSPRSGSTGPVKVGRKVPTGMSPPVGLPAVAMNYGELAEFELAVDVNQDVYNSTNVGQSVDNTLCAIEINLMIFEQIMLRTSLIRTVIPTIVIRKDPKFSFGALGQLSGEWLREPLKSTRWDCVWSTYGHSSAGGIGHGFAASFCAGALYHEATHNWGAGHTAYYSDAHGGNLPSIGPINFEKMLNWRQYNIDHGYLSPAQPYPDPLAPYTYLDVARVNMNTPQDIDVLANDWDVNGDTLSVSNFTTTTRQGGTVTLNPNGTLHYVPAPGFVGKDMVVYSAQDSSPAGLKCRDILHIEVVNNDLMAHYRFDETSGSIAANAVSGGTIGSLNSADFATDSVLSPLGRGVRAAGVKSAGSIEGAGIIMGAVPAIPVEQPLALQKAPFETNYNQLGCGYDMMDGDYSFATWFRSDAYPTGNTYIASKWWNGGSRLGWDMRMGDYIDPVTRVRTKRLWVQWRAFDGLAPSIWLCSEPYDFIPGKWYHTACVFDRSTGEVRLYLDGARVATKTNAFPGTSFVFAGRASLMLGYLSNRKACFDDARLYSKVLSDGDVQALYSGPGAAPRFLESPMAVAIHAGVPLRKSLWPVIWTGSGADLTFSKVSGPSWLNVSANAELTGTPGAGDTGMATAVIRMSNGGTSADLTVNLDVQDAQLRARWHFDEGSGTTAADASGNGKAATLIGATWGQPSREGPYSLATDSVSAQYAQAPPLNTTGGFTLCGWINPSIFTGIHTIISQQGSYAFKQHGSTLVLSIPSIADHNTPSGTLFTGTKKWQHVAVSFNPGTAEGVKFYVDGLLKCTLDASTFNQSTFPTLIGKTSDWSNQNFTGGLDDLRVYGLVLSEEEIGDIAAEYATHTVPKFAATPAVAASAVENVPYNSTLNTLVSDPDAGDTLTYSKISGPAWLIIASNGTMGGTPALADVGVNSFSVRVVDSTGNTVTSTVNISVNRYLAAHWKFDEGIGSVLADASGSGMTGTSFGGTWSLARVGAFSLSIRGRPDTYAYGPPVDMRAGGTLSGWFKPDVLTGVTSLITQQDCYYLRTNGTGLTLTIPSVGDLNTPDGILTLNEWQHIAVSLNPGTTGGAKFYVNGVLVSTLDMPALTQNTNITVIGRTAFNNSMCYDGAFDDLRIYSVPLSGALVADLYNSYHGMTAPQFTSDPITGAPWGGYGWYAGTLAGSAVDADGDPENVLKYSKVSGPSWLAVASNGNLTGMPPSAAGLNTFVVKVTDSSGLIDTATLNITDIANVRPTFTANPMTGAGATEDSAYSGSIASYGTDANGGTLTYEKVSGPPWLSVATNGALSGTPDNSHVGVNIFTVKIIDSWGASTNGTLNITVTNTNDAPTFAASPFSKSQAICLVSYSGSIAADVTDPDAGDLLTFSKLSGPAWLNVASNGDLSGDPPDTEGGVNSFVVQVKDGGLLSAAATLQIPVTGVAWANPAGGSWTSTGNWNGNVIASGANKIANFSNLDLTADATVTLDGARTIGHLTFGDTAASNNWLLNTGSGGSLTLDVAAGSPQVTVSNQTATIGAVIAGNDGLTKTGTGTLVLNAANTYTGGTTVSGGSLAIGNVGALGSGNVALGNGSIFRVNYMSASSTVANTLSVAAGNSAQLDLTGSGVSNNTLTFGSGAITVNGTFKVSRSSGGTGLTNFAGNLTGSGILEVANTQAGTVPGNASSLLGRCVFTSATAFNAFTGDIRILPTANLALFGGNLNGQDVTIEQNGFLSLLGGVTTTVGNLDGAGVITKNAGGTATLKVASGDFSGAISRSTLQASGLTLLTKTGPGTFTLGGDHSYVGATTVSGGTLNLTGILDETQMTVQSGATLTGTGLTRGKVTVQSGGTLAPGVAGMGTLTIKNLLVLSGSTAMQIARDGEVFTNDEITGPSTLTYGGTLNVTHVGADPLVAGNSFRLFTATIYNGNFATFNLPPLAEGLVWDTTRLGVDGTIVVDTVPVAEDDELVSLEDESVLIGVLENDIDVDSDALLIQSVTQGDHGTVVIEDDQIRYTPVANWSGNDSFNYVVTDSRGGSSTASVSLTVASVNDTPTLAALPDADATEDVAFSGSVTSAAGDIESGTLTFSKTSGPAWLNVAANGVLSGTPLNSDAGANHYVIRVTDGGQAYAESPLVINVEGINDAPTFTTNPFTKAAATAVTPYSGSIAANASDVDAGDTLSFSKVSGPAWLSIASNGDLSGTPAGSDAGLNSFSVKVMDVAGASNTATLQITVTSIIWTNVAGGSWPVTGNWNAGIVANGTGVTANFATLNLTTNATATLDGAHTVGHFVFGDTTPSHNWTVNSGSGGPLTLDVAAGSPSITVNNQTTTLGAVVAGNDGLTKTGTGTLALTVANAYSGGTTISDGILAIGNVGALGSGGATIGNGTLRVNFLSASPTLSNTLAVAADSSATLDLIGSGSSGNTLTLGTGTITANGTLRVTRSAGNTGTTNFSAPLAGSGVLEIGNTQAGVAPSSSSLTQGRCIFTSPTAYAGFSGSIRVLSGGNLCLFNGNLNGQNVTLESGGYLSLLGGATTVIGDLNGSGTFTKNAGGNATLHVGSGNFSGVIAQNLLSGTGTTALTKIGGGILNLSGASTYTAPTTVSGGTLNIIGSLGVTNTTVQTGAILGGTGTIGGTVTVQSGGTLAPGVAGTGTLTLASKALTLSGTAAMEIGRNGGTLSNDQVAGITTATYGGTLLVTKTSADALQAGDAFRLFSATTYSGSYATVTLPSLAAGLSWNTSRLVVDGYISVQGSVPSGWTAADIGSAGVPGGSHYASGAYTVSGSGAAIGGTADAFQSVSQTLTGDGEIRARITSQTNTHAQALAGLMLRDGSASNGVNAFIGLTPANGFVFQTRSSSGGSTTQIGTVASNAAPNNWLRLTRSGTVIAAYVSADGATWTQVGATALTMASNVSAGLAVTSHDNAVSGTAVFDNVNITPYPSPWLTGDIGSAGIAGRSEFYDNTHTLNGAGVVAGTADGLRLTYQTLSADGALIARIPVFANTGTGSRIGVMIRDTLAANSSHIFIGTDGSGTFTWTRRTTTGGTTTSSNSGTATAANVWVRLVRTGNDIAASTSTNGTTWVSAGTVTVSMAANCFIGLAVGSGNTTGLNTSDFDSVSVTP